ncbi:hypothetical protein MMC18_008370 [Xylographa bjoerkii]|nr:hypothetical protein [Xylographa bjoerkii]
MYLHCTIYLILFVPSILSVPLSLDLRSSSDPYGRHPRRLLDETLPGIHSVCRGLDKGTVAASSSKGPAPVKAAKQGNIPQASKSTTPKVKASSKEAVPKPATAALTSKAGAKPKDTGSEVPKSGVAQKSKGTRKNQLDTSKGSSTIKPGSQVKDKPSAEPAQNLSGKGKSFKPKDRQPLQQVQNSKEHSRGNLPNSKSSSKGVKSAPESKMTNKVLLKPAKQLPKPAAKAAQSLPGTGESSESKGRQRLKEVQNSKEPRRGNLYDSKASFEGVKSTSKSKTASKDSQKPAKQLPKPNQSSQKDPTVPVGGGKSQSKSSTSDGKNFSTASKPHPDSEIQKDAKKTKIPLRGTVDPGDNQRKPKIGPQSSYSGEKPGNPTRKLESTTNKPKLPNPDSTQKQQKAKTAGGIVPTKGNTAIKISNSQSNTSKKQNNFRKQAGNSAKDASKLADAGKPADDPSCQLRSRGLGKRINECGNPGPERTPSHNVKSSPYKKSTPGERAAKKAQRLAKDRTTQDSQSQAPAEQEAKKAAPQSDEQAPHEENEQSALHEAEHSTAVDTQSPAQENTQTTPLFDFRPSSLQEPAPQAQPHGQNPHVPKPKDVVPNDQCLGSNCVHVALAKLNGVTASQVVDQTGEMQASGHIGGLSIPVANRMATQMPTPHKSSTDPSKVPPGPAAVMYTRPDGSGHTVNREDGPNGHRYIDYQATPNGLDVTDEVNQGHIANHIWKDDHQPTAGGSGSTAAGSSSNTPPTTPSTEHAHNPEHVPMELD